MKKLQKLFKKFEGQETKYGLIRFLNNYNNTLILENGTHSFQLCFSDFIMKSSPFRNFDFVEIDSIWEFTKNLWKINNLKVLKRREEIFSDFRPNEFHISSNFSKLDSTLKIDELFEFISFTKIKKISITDFTSIQAYPELLEKANKNNVEVILGTECLMFDDTKKLFNIKKDDVFFVIDLETNGVNPRTCELLEVAVYKIKNSIILEKFNSLIHI